MQDQETITTMTAVAVTEPDITRATQRPVQRPLQEHVQKLRAAYDHALQAQEGLLFSAWVNGQYELAELRAQRQRKQIAWAIYGGRAIR